MKKLAIISFVLILLMGMELKAKPSIEVSFGFFYSSLRNHGEWIQIDADVVGWRPHHVHKSWKPYTQGRWSWTRHGWYWDSDEPFGWAVYHYGRWYYDDYYGWIWIPDYEWGPAWVEWRYNDDYIGWAPLPPYASFHIDLGIRFSLGWRASYNWWNFVSYHRFCDRRMNYYLLDYNKTSRIFGSTRYRNNYYYDRDRIVNGGIDRSYVERRGGYRIAERDLRFYDDRNDFERNRGGERDRIAGYRPSESEMRTQSTPERFQFNRGERSSTIEREKIAISRFNERERDFEVKSERDKERSIDRSNERRLETDIERNRDIQRNDKFEIERRREDTEEKSRIERENNARMESERKREIQRRDEERQMEMRREAENRNRVEKENQARRVESQRSYERRIESGHESSSSRVESNERRGESRSESRGSKNNDRESRGSVERRR